MSVYKFEAMDATGQTISDTIEASDLIEAQQVIRQMGYFVTKIGRKAISDSSEDAGFTFTISSQTLRIVICTFVWSLAAFILGVLIGVLLGGLK